MGQAGPLESATTWGASWVNDAERLQHRLRHAPAGSLSAVNLAAHADHLQIKADDCYVGLAEAA